MWLRLLADEFGCTDDELHEIYKQSFLGTKDVEIKGKKFKTIKSTTDLNREEFKTYLEKIEQTAIKYNIRLPHPEDESWEQFFKEYG